MYNMYHLRVKRAPASTTEIAVAVNNHSVCGSCFPRPRLCIVRYLFTVTRTTAVNNYRMTALRSFQGVIYTHIRKIYKCCMPSSVNNQ
jgi:hypothetical protein